MRPGPPLRRSTIHVCSFRVLRDTPFRDGNRLGFWPHITGFWRGSQQNYPLSQAFGGEASKITPLLLKPLLKLTIFGTLLQDCSGKIWKLPLIKNISGKKCYIKDTYFNDFSGFFPPNWGPKIYPFPREIGNEHTCMVDRLSVGGGGDMRQNMRHISPHPLWWSI